MNNTRIIPSITMWIIPCKKNYLRIGYQIYNVDTCPKERNRVIKYTSGFMPDAGLGYYIDIYIHTFIRKIKKYLIKKRCYVFLGCINKLNLNLNLDLQHYICSFILN